MDKSLIILMKKKRSKPQVTKLEIKEKTFLPSLVKLKGSQGNKILETVLSTNWISQIKWKNASCQNSFKKSGKYE